MKKLAITLLVLSFNLMAKAEIILGSDCLSTVSTTIGLALCYDKLSNQKDAELKVKLNNIYQEYPKLAPKLKQSYQHWLTYRESHCRLVYDAWGDGSARHYAWSKCKYEMATDWNNPMYINYK